jgi:pSer/pThr/pTyr-binding forkhead associated (FHA) protein
MPVQFSSKHAVTQFFPVLKIAGDTAVRAPVALTKAVCVIGRRWGVHLPLASKQVSKLHALIVRERDGVYIRDLASRNRLFVNGEPVRESELGPGDVVKVGPYALKCASGFTSRDGTGAPGARGPAAYLEPDRAGAPPVPLDGRAVLIGRREECELALPADDDGASPVHAVVFEIDGKRFVRDLTSAAGTLVNGRKIHQEELRPGDELRVGRTRIRYSVEGAAGAVRAPDEAEADRVDELSLDAMNTDSPAPIQMPDADLVEADVAAPSPFDDILPADDDDPHEPVRTLRAPPNGDDEEPVVNLAEIIAVPTHRPDDDDDQPIAIDPTPADDPAEPPTLYGTSAAEQLAAPAAQVAEVPAAEAPEAPAAQIAEIAPASADAVVVADAVANPAADADPEQLVPLRTGDRPVGVIDAAVRAAADAPSPEAEQLAGGGFTAIPLANVIELDLAVGGLPAPEAEVREHTPAAIVPSRPPDCADGGVGGGGENPDAPTAQRPDDPVRKLDKIVSELADRVADLGATWEEVKAKGDPDR